MRALWEDETLRWFIILAIVAGGIGVGIWESFGWLWRHIDINWIK